MIIVVGDVKHEGVVQLANKYWAGWKRGNYKPEIPNEPEQTTAVTSSVDWPTPTLPWIAVSFKGPAYSDTEKELRRLTLSAVSGSQTSELYQKLVIKNRRWT